VAHTVLVVSQPEEMGYPADIEFGQNNLQARKTIEDAVVDELGEGALRRVMQAGMTVAWIVAIVLKTMACEGMQAERQVEVLRRRPERLLPALLVAVALGGIRDDHGAFETQICTALEFPHGAVHVPH